MFTLLYNYHNDSGHRCGFYLTSSFEKDPLMTYERIILVYE